MPKLFKIMTAALVAAALTAGTGCTSPDPDGRYQDFVDNTEEDRRIPDAGEVEGGKQVDFSGRYLFALFTTLNSDAPFLFEATVDVDENFVFDLTVQPLTTDTDENPRTPVGDPIVVEGVQLNEDGTFEADLGVVAAPGAANPVTGSDIVAEIVLQGNVLETDQFCGNATGVVTAPLDNFDITGSTFGTVGVAADAELTGIEPLIKCPEGTGPVDDAGMDGGMEDAGEDAGMPDDRFYRCPDVDFAGTWTFEFKSGLQSERATLIFELTEDADPTRCYSGEVFSGADGTTDLGDVTAVVEREGQLIIRVPNFVIPEGANAALPQGGTSDITGFTAGYTADGACGDFETTITSNANGAEIPATGTWSMLKDGAAGLSFDEDLAVSGCEAIIRDTECAFTDVAEDYTLQFQTSVQSSATNVLVRLEANDLTCLNGVVESTDTPDFVLSRIINAEDDGSGNLVLNGRNFFIPASSNPVGNDPLWADFPVTTEELDPGVSMCGEMMFLIVSPPDFPLTMQTGGFAAGTAGNEPTMPGCP